MLYPQVVDRGNWFVVEQAFTFDSDRRELRRKILIYLLSNCQKWQKYQLDSIPPMKLGVEIMKFCGASIHKTIKI